MRATCRSRSSCPGSTTLAISDYEQQIAANILERSAQPLALSARRRTRLSHAQSRDAHALGRRGAAHRARELARLEARRHALRARRAVDRAASARRRSTALAAAPAARRRQHGARRRARSRGDSPRGLHGGARARERRAGRTGGVRGSDVAREREPAHGRISERREGDPASRKSVARSVRGGSRSPARASTTCAASTFASRSARSPS